MAYVFTKSRSPRVWGSTNPIRRWIFYSHLFILLPTLRIPCVVVVALPTACGYGQWVCGIPLRVLLARPLVPGVLLLPSIVRHKGQDYTFGQMSDQCYLEPDAGKLYLCEGKSYLCNNLSVTGMCLIRTNIQNIQNIKLASVK